MCTCFSWDTFLPGSNTTYPYISMGQLVNQGIYSVHTHKRAHKAFTHAHIYRTAGNFHGPIFTDNQLQKLNLRNKLDYTVHNGNE